MSRRTFTRLPANVARDPEHTSKVMTTFMEEVDERLNSTAYGDITATSVTSTGLFDGFVLSTGSTRARRLRDRFAEIVNVKDFGAVADGVTPDNAAFHDAADYAATLSPVGALYIPTGNYLFDTSTPPVRIKDPQMVVMGEGVNSKITASTSAFVFQIAPEMAALPIVAGLPTAFTHEFGMDYNQRLGEVFYIQVSDGMTPGYLNGRSAFCVQGFYKPADTAETAVLMYSRGRLHTSHAESYCFRLEVKNTDRSVRGHLVVGGVTYQCNTGAGLITAGNMYDIAMTFDGSNIRIFVEGNLEATTAAVGTITQDKWERVVQGSLLRDCWGSDIESDGPRGVVSHWEIANVVRHTANYTKRTAFSEDGNTVASTRLSDTIYYTDAAVRLRGGSAPWVPVYQEYFNTGVVGETRLTDFCISGANYAIFSAANTRGYYDRLTLQHAAQYGLVLYDNNYFSQVSRCEIWGGRIPFVATGASGVLTARDCTFRGGIIQAVGSGVKYDNAFFQGENDTLVNIVVESKGGGAGGAQFDFCSFSDEAGSGPLIANVIGDSLRHLSFYGCSFEHARAGDDAHLILDADVNCLTGFPVVIDACDFIGFPPNGGTNITVTSTSAVWPKGHIRVRNYQNSSTGVPDCSVDDLLIVEGRDAYEYEGYVDITGAATTSAVTFTTDEPDAAYGIHLSTGVEGGAPAAGSTRPFYTARATTGFTINLEVAPGIGNTVRVHWRLKR